MRKKEKDLSNVVLLCPKNDAEAYLILEIAEKIGLKTIESNQHHGASLENEKYLLKNIRASRKKEVWIVEIPGKAEEKYLKSKGLKIKIIDHHWYEHKTGKIDRTKKNKKYLPSSLEQFLKLAKISKQDLKDLGYEPKITLGIGYLDAGYIQALVKRKYTKKEIEKTAKLERKMLVKIFPSFRKGRAQAVRLWKQKKKKGKFIIVRSKHLRDLRAQIADVAATNGFYNKPLITSDYNGGKIYVQNVDRRLVKKLQNNFKGHTFTFGQNRCWGIDNFKTKKQGKDKVTLKEILNLLNINAKKFRS